jgi:hypothetical protein
MRVNMFLDLSVVRQFKFRPKIRADRVLGGVCVAPPVEAPFGMHFCKI